MEPVGPRNYTHETISKRGKGRIVDEIFDMRVEIDESIKIASDPMERSEKRAYYREKVAKLADRIQKFKSVLLHKIGSKRHKSLVLSVFNRNPGAFEHFVAEKYDYEAWRGPLHSILDKKVMTSEDTYIVVTVHDMLLKYIEWISTVKTPW